MVGSSWDTALKWTDNDAFPAYRSSRSPAPLPCELNSSGTVTASNTWGADGLVSRRVGTTSTFYVFDPQGSVSARLNDQGALVSSDLYDAYGSLRDGNPNNDPVGYCGQWGYYTDHSTGYILCTFRWYDPLTARWLTRDPIGYRGGINLYGYVGGNPVGAVDPEGLSRWKLPLDADGNPLQEPFGVSVDNSIQRVAIQQVTVYRSLRLLNVDHSAAINQSGIETSLWFIDLVRPDHEWDFKNNPRLVCKNGQRGNFEPYGNFHYGACAAALGWPEEMALKLAGLAQMLWDVLHRKLPQKTPNHDDPRDQANIRLGYRYFQEHYQ